MDDNLGNCFPVTASAIRVMACPCGVQASYPTTGTLIRVMGAAPVTGDGMRPWLLRLDLNVLGLPNRQVAFAVPQGATQRQISEAIAALELPDGVTPSMGVAGSINAHDVLLQAPQGKLFGGVRCTADEPESQERDPRRDPYIAELSGAGFVQQTQVWQ